MSDTVFCKDCKWAKKSFWESGYQLRCMHESSYKHPGEPDLEYLAQGCKEKKKRKKRKENYNYCTTQRSGQCGTEAKFFEPNAKFMKNDPEGKAVFTVGRKLDKI